MINPPRKFCPNCKEWTIMEEVLVENKKTGDKTMFICTMCEKTLEEIPGTGKVKLSRADLAGFLRASGKAT